MYTHTTLVLRCCATGNAPVHHWRCTRAVLVLPCTALELDTYFTRTTLHWCCTGTPPAPYLYPPLVLHWSSTSIPLVFRWYCTCCAGTAMVLALRWCGTGPRLALQSYRFGSTPDATLVRHPCCSGTALATEIILEPYWHYARGALHWCRTGNAPIPHRYPTLLHSKCSSAARKDNAKIRPNPSPDRTIRSETSDDNPLSPSRRSRATRLSTSKRNSLS